MTQLQDKHDMVTDVLVRIFTDSDFTNDIEKFAFDHCKEFRNTSVENEQKFEHTQLYNKFQELFEAKLESMLAKENIPIEDFVEYCQKNIGRDNDLDDTIRYIIGMVPKNLYC